VSKHERAKHTGVITKGGGNDKRVDGACELAGLKISVEKLRNIFMKRLPEQSVA
jgi:hypothetical protein